MLVIDSVRIRNFRAIKEARLVPLKDGITGIFGSNGAGKTTFLTAVLFALYGVRPSGVPVSGLRREKSSFDEECSVSVVFQHMGQTIEVIREISGKNNKTTAFVYVDGKEEATTSVSYVDKFIRDRLGIDAEGFMTAFVVRQKELDLLVSAKPAARKQLIERLAGIENINLALKSARENENASKKALGSMAGSVEAYDKAEKDYQESEIYMAELIKDYSIAKEITEKAETRFETLFESLSRSKEKISILDSLQNRKESKKRELAELKERLIASEKRLSGVTEAQVTELEKELSLLDGQLVDARENFNKKKVDSDTHKAHIERLTNEKATYDKLVKPTLSHTFTRDELKQTIEVSENTIHSLNELIAELKQTLKSNKAHKDLLGEGECPTCHREWENPQDETKSLDEENEKIVKEINDNTTKIGDLRQTITDTRALMDELSSFEHEISNYNTKKLRGKEIVKEITDLQKLILTQTELNNLVGEGKKIAGQRDAKQQQYIEAKQALSFQKEVEDLRVRVINTEEEYKKLIADVEQKEITRPDIREIEIEVREARTYRDKIREKLGFAKDEFDEANKKHYAIKSVFDTVSSEWASKQKAYETHQVTVATTDVLDTFRKDAISRLAPELSDYATSLISDMTSGAFTEIVLDEDFTPSVITSAGITRPVAWLSGGEESAVALALRLAIAFLITNGNPELLWLDEVLTAQDTDRRNSMLAMVRNLPISQIMLINHTQEAGDVVDKAVTLIADTDNGSTIEEN